MVNDIVHTTTILAVLGSGLMGGIFLIFSNTVMSALAGIQSSQGIAAMQAINRAILNPLFFGVFFGTAAICGLLIISLFWRWHLPGAIYLFIGSILYLAGVLMVTVVFNVPMNEALDTVAPKSVEGTGMWETYLTRWTAWNHIRTVAAVLGTASFILALG